MDLALIIEQKIEESKKPSDVVSKALSIPEPDGVKEYSEEKVNDYLDLLNYASSVQKKEVLKSDEDEHQVNIYDDIEDKIKKWNDYSDENFGDSKKESPNDDGSADKEKPEDLDKDGDGEVESEDVDKAIKDL